MPIKTIYNLSQVLRGKECQQNQECSSGKIETVKKKFRGYNKLAFEKKLCGELFSRFPGSRKHSSECPIDQNTVAQDQDKKGVKKTS